MAPALCTTYNTLTLAAEFVQPTVIIVMLTRLEFQPFVGTSNVLLVMACYEQLVRQEEAALLVELVVLVVRLAQMALHQCALNANHIMH